MGKKHINVSEKYSNLAYMSFSIIFENVVNKEIGL
jgi:hypothetical protein